jgi:hypothetical protein
MIAVPQAVWIGKRLVGYRAASEIGSVNGGIAIANGSCGLLLAFPHA